ncbi:hypothetical protein GCM10009579_42070 [Streptomyces javensis]|uniref:Uncharacterized protein n=1 Tax=Streptomyces javensis TaxID=114698 RepID=A0ABP4HP85_9ACTN
MEGVEGGLDPLQVLDDVGVRAAAVQMRERVCGGHGSSKCSRRIGGHGSACRAPPGASITREVIGAEAIAADVIAADVIAADAMAAEVMAAAPGLSRRCPGLPA